MGCQSEIMIDQESADLLYDLGEADWKELTNPDFI